MIEYYTSEEDVLKTINSFFPHAVLRQDDAALLPQQHYVTSVDIVGQDLDFRLNTFPPYNIGYKALAVNISDILAMGALPRYFLMALSIPHTIDKVFFGAILQGMATLAKQYDIKLIGGDIAFESSLRFAITIIGNPLTQAIHRGNVKVGDSIFYIPSASNPYPLGLARLGFDALEAGVKSYPSAITAQQAPSLVDITCVEHLAPFAQEISLMDCSDGLLQDIPRLIQYTGSSLGAEIEIHESFLHEEVLAWCASKQCSPIEYAYQGGEEYCLLGSAPASCITQLQQAIPELQKIGFVVDKKHILCNGIQIQ